MQEFRYALRSTSLVNVEMVLRLAVVFLAVVGLLSVAALPQGLTCPSYEQLATPAAAQLSPARYEGFWYEVSSTLTRYAHYSLCSLPALLTIPDHPLCSLQTLRDTEFPIQVYSHNVFLVDACHCTRYNFTMVSASAFTDDFVCHKNTPDSDPYVIHNKGQSTELGHQLTHMQAL